MTRYSKNWTKEKQRECTKQWSQKHPEKIREYGRKHNPKVSKEQWKEGKKFWQKNPLLYKYYMKGYHAASRRND